MNEICLKVINCYCCHCVADCWLPRTYRNSYLFFMDKLKIYCNIDLSPAIQINMASVCVCVGRNRLPIIHLLSGYWFFSFVVAFFALSSFIFFYVGLLESVSLILFLLALDQYLLLSIHLLHSFNMLLYFTHQFFSLFWCSIYAFILHIYP